MTLWYFLNTLALLMQFAIGVLAIRRDRFAQTPFWYAACLWSIVPQGFYLLSGGVRITTWYTVLEFTRSAVRIVVTSEAIGLLFLLCTGLGWTRFKLVVSGAFAISSAALLMNVSGLGYVRIWCFAALSVAVIASLSLAYPTLSYVKLHVGLMFVYLGSAAVASAGGSVKGDYLDISAVSFQIAAYVWWIIDPVGPLASRTGVASRSARRVESPGSALGESTKVR